MSDNVAVDDDSRWLEELISTFRSEPRVIFPVPCVSCLTWSHTFDNNYDVLNICFEMY